MIRYWVVLAAALTLHACALTPDSLNSKAVALVDQACTRLTPGERKMLRNSANAELKAKAGTGREGHRLAGICCEQDPTRPVCEALRQEMEAPAP